MRDEVFSRLECTNERLFVNFDEEKKLFLLEVELEFDFLRVVDKLGVRRNVAGDSILLGSFVPRRSRFRLILLSIFQFSIKFNKAGVLLEERCEYGSVYE